MDLQTNLIGRLRNTNLPKKDVLYPLFEAVVNSINSIDDRIVKKAISITDTKTSDNMVFFGYNHNYNAYIEVFSFDRLVNSAKERNRAFFDKLGLPTT